MTLPRALLLVALGLPACFIGQTSFENAFCKLDEDGDGDPKCGLSNTTSDGDCDDSNPLISNRRGETGERDESGEVVGGAYDGFDNDCSDGDLLDVDGDGVPGISREEYDALPVHEPWPSEFRDLTEVDCLDLHPTEQEALFGVTYPDDIAFSVKPTTESDEPYDGLDGNCDGSNDFDADGDGYVTSDLPDWYEDYLAFYEGVPDLPRGDCNDNDDSIFPDSPTPDVPYDGQDQDCSADNDFDPDGDGNLTDGFNGSAGRYVQLYGYEDQPWTDWVPGGDCLDLRDTFDGADPPDGLPARTFRRLIGSDGLCPDGGSPTAAGSCEASLDDGYDDACDDVLDGRVRFNEYDRDGDGYVDAADRAAFIAYVQRYLAFENANGENPYAQPFTDTYGDTAEAIGAWFDANAGDCDDTDPAINPDALEVLGDGVDRDCDGDSDTTRTLDGGFSWRLPGPPRMALTDQHHVLVVPTREGFDAADGAGLRPRRVVGLSWDREVGAAGRPAVDEPPFIVPNTTSDDIHGHAAVISQGLEVFVGTSWNGTTSTRLQAVKMDRDRLTAANYQVLAESSWPSRPVVATYDRVDLSCDGGTCWQVACNDTEVHFTVFDDTNRLTQGDTGVVPGLSPADCFVVPAGRNGGTAVVGVVGDLGTVDAYEMAPLALNPATTNPFAGLEVDWVRGRTDRHLMGLATGGVLAWTSPTTSTTLFPGSGWVDADAVETTDGTWIFVGLRDDGETILAYGTPGSFDEVVLDPRTPEGSPLPVTRVAVSADTERVVVVLQVLDGTDLTHVWSVYGR
jgi:hypothetical protein